MFIFQVFDVRRADIEVIFDLVVGGGNFFKLGLLKVIVDCVLYVFGVFRMQVQFGGIFFIYNQVKSYFNVRSFYIKGLEDGYVDGYSVWVMIYFCLRCGDF